jgi:copper oxidase (laccase) domain-containing protein
MPKFYATPRGVVYCKEFPVRHGFSTTRMGNMSFRFGEERKVAAARDCAFQEMEIPGQFAVNIFPPEHGDNIEQVNLGDGPNVACDGLFTCRHRVPLTLSPADCVPIFITDRSRQFIALIHAGRKGTELGIVTKALHTTTTLFDLDSLLIVVLLGPAIRTCCYDHDLIGANLSQLRAFGIARENIYDIGLCTSCARDVFAGGDYMFFSHRRASRNGSSEARFLAMTCL